MLRKLEKLDPVKLLRGAEPSGLFIPKEVDEEGMADPKDAAGWLAAIALKPEL